MCWTARMFSTPAASAATARGAEGSGRSYLSVSSTSDPGWPVPMTTMLSAGWNPSSPGMAASSVWGELIRTRCCGVRASGGVAAGPGRAGSSGGRWPGEAEGCGCAVGEGLCVMGTACGGADAKMGARYGTVDKGREIHSDRKVLLDGISGGWYRAGRLESHAEQRVGGVADQRRVLGRALG